MERALFALVANRAIDPSSKLAAADWASQDVAIPGLDRMDDDQAYRAMDLLVEADTDAKVQEAVFFAVADLLNLEVDLLFFDITSTYFERDTEDPDPADSNADPEGASGFRRYGHSKDHRRDLLADGRFRQPAALGHGRPGPVRVAAHVRARCGLQRRDDHVFDLVEGDRGRSAGSWLVGQPVQAALGESAAPALHGGGVEAELGSFC